MKYIVIMRRSHAAMLVLTMMGIYIFSNTGLTYASEYYSWPEYSPNVAYDYKLENGTVPPPTEICPDGVYDDYTGEPVSTYIDRWWCFRWGSNANPAVTEDAWIPMLERFNEDFDYITNVMGWPRDRRAKEGYYSTVYLYGSGLSTDNASNTDGGGWMGSAGGYPMVLASYIPVTAFNPATPDGYQSGAMIHEGIHAVLADMPGCFNSCWFHEGGNTWLQATMEAQRSGSFTGLGWLSVGSAIAPFMPIECYSGWLQDGTFGGPCAQGVNVFENGQQICTWRNLLGGAQYSESFPHALEVILGPKSLAWVWNNAKYSGRVLQDLAEAPGGLGETQTRRLIQEYRARQAFCDFGLWSYAYRQLLHGGWNVTIQEEWSPYLVDVDPWYATCYAGTTQNGSTLTPDALTLPGWSGANQVPLTVNPGATEATVTFNPIGSNMSCQLVYRDTSGNVHYGIPVSSGACSIPLANVMNNVIVAVICNTDYIYVDDTTRTTKFDYTLTIGAGINGPADIYTKWFAYNPSSYTITASADANGSISPSGNVVVSAGGSRTFNFTPNSGYEVGEVVLNGFSIGPMSSYTLNDVRGDCTISATFRLSGLISPETWESVPASTGTDTIFMIATQSDAGSGFEYYFEETSGNPGGSDSGWQSSPIYTDTGLSELTQYTYRVRMRDADGYTGNWSTSESAVTQFAGERNIALFASVSTSHVSPWETLGAVNDNYIPTSSSDNSHGAYGNWDGTNGTWNWVEYDFGAVYQINHTDMYWWQDGGGILQPTDASIEYWDGSSWVNAGDIGLNLNQWNTMDTSFSTSKIRVNMVSSISTGILEWQVWGQVAAPSFTTDPINEVDATEAYVYNSTMADNATDPGSRPLTFSKIYGPTWLSVADNGALSGIPTDLDVGENTFAVRVTNDLDLIDVTTMTVNVNNVYSGARGMDDLIGFAVQWLAMGSTDAPACGGADLDGDNNVTLMDFSLLGYHWMLDYNLQLHLKLDETSGDTANDSSIYQRDGLLTNGPTWTSDPERDALDFDGVDDYVEIPGYKGITGLTSRSCTFWINTTDTQADILGWGRLFDDSQQTVQGQKWQVVFYNNEVGALVQGGNAFCAAPEVNDGQWHHVVIVLDDTNQDGILNIDETQFYIDGDLREQSRAASFAVNTAAHNDVHISKYPEGNTYLLNGSLDEIRIYDRVLTEQEIQEFAGY